MSGDHSPSTFVSLCNTCDSSNVKCIFDDKRLPICLKCAKKKRLKL